MIAWFLDLGGNVKAILAVTGGAVVAFLVFSTWNAIWDNPRVRDDARSKMTAQFYEAIGELNDTAAEARAKRNLCIAVGGVWDFAGSRCTEG